MKIEHTHYKLGIKIYFNRFYHIYINNTFLFSCSSKLNIILEKVEKTYRTSMSFRFWTPELIDTLYQSPDFNNNSNNSPNCSDDELSFDDVFDNCNETDYELKDEDYLNSKDVEDIDINKQNVYISRLPSSNDEWGFFDNLSPPNPNLNNSVYKFSV